MPTVTPAVPVARLTNEQLITELEQRVAGLYRMNAELAAQVDRMRPVVDIAIEWANADNGSDDEDSAGAALVEEVCIYEQAMVQLAKGGTG